MNLIAYVVRTLAQMLVATVKPDGWHCWLRLQTHDWNGSADSLGWATKHCDDCGHRVVCGL